MLLHFRRRYARVRTQRRARRMPLQQFFGLLLSRLRRFLWTDATWHGQAWWLFFLSATTTSCGPAHIFRCAFALAVWFSCGKIEDDVAWRLSHRTRHFDRNVLLKRSQLGFGSSTRRRRGRIVSKRSQLGFISSTRRRRGRIVLSKLHSQNHEVRCIFVSRPFTKSTWHMYPFPVPSLLRGHSGLDHYYLFWRCCSSFLVKEPSKIIFHLVTTACLRYVRREEVKRKIYDE